MTDIFDISTVDGRRTLLEADSSESIRDRLLRAGGFIGPAQSATSARVAADDRPDSVDDNGSEAEAVRRLQRNLDMATLDLSSARRTLRTYRLGVRALMASAALCGLLVVAGLAVAIASSMVSVDASTPVAWLMAFGWPMLLASVAGMFGWVRMHRINYEWRKKDSYNGTTYAIDSKDYVDPEHNVDIAQLKYSNALTKLTQHQG